MRLQKEKTVYDVCIVGSGAGGGMAAKILSESGLKVAILEAGGDWDPAKEEYRTQLRFPYESPRRGAGTNRVFSRWKERAPGTHVIRDRVPEAYGALVR